jgi:MFS family permease
MSSYVRQLDTYPTGRRRVVILSMAVLASLICSFEAQIAPVVPLLLEDLRMSLTTYGGISASAALAGAVAGLLGGRLTDTVGRVRLLVPLMMLTSLLCFGTTLVHSPGQLLAARIVLSFVDGVAVASTAPLVRDFSPRMGRATAFAFWTWGPVGANFLAAAIAGATLAVFGDSWRSQFVIMGCISLVLSLVIAANIAELSPALRAKILQTERRALGAADDTRPLRSRELLRHRAIWAHCLGIASWLVTYLTLSLYGQTMLVDTFGVTTSEASRIMMVFWVLNLGTLVLAGRLSDRLQLRRPFSLAGTVVAMVCTVLLIGLMADPADTSMAALMVTGVLLGAGLGVAYGPWMANYSENAEDVDPRLQGSAWGLFSFISKAMAVVVLLVAPRVVEAADWGAWMWLSLGFMALFGVAIVFFRGPWRRPRNVVAALTVHPDGDAPVVPVPAPPVAAEG